MPDIILISRPIMTFPNLLTYLTQIFNLSNSSLVPDNPTILRELNGSEIWKLKRIERSRFPWKGLPKPSLP
jgi:hypothetical protein